MSRKHKRKDHNHNSLMQAFQRLGVSVFDAANIGGGFPDLICGYRGWTYLVEIKNPHNDYGRAGFNENQAEFAATWRGGPVEIARTLDDVVALVDRWVAPGRPKG